MLLLTSKLTSLSAVKATIPTTAIAPVAPTLPIADPLLPVAVYGPAVSIQRLAACESSILEHTVLHVSDMSQHSRCSLEMENRAVKLLLAQILGEDDVWVRTIPDANWKKLRTAGISYVRHALVTSLIVSCR
jgi:hypothetical protein